MGWEPKILTQFAVETKSRLPDLLPDCAKISVPSFIAVCATLFLVPSSFLGLGGRVSNLSAPLRYVRKYVQHSKKMTYCFF